MNQLFVNYAFVEILDYMIKNVKPEEVDDMEWTQMKLFQKRRYIFPEFDMFDYLEILRDVRIEDAAADYSNPVIVLNIYWNIIGKKILLNYRYHPYIIEEYRRLYHPMEI